MADTDAPVFTIDDDLLSVRLELGALTARVRHLQETSPSRAPWMASDRWLTCDGGALAVALIARDLGIPTRLCAGLYWHTDPRLRAEAMGDVPEEDDADGMGWAEHLAWVERNAMDEHHHWVVLWPEDPVPVLIDPNGPCRDEPYAQTIDRDERVWGTEELRFTYSELPPGDPWRAVAYDPDDDWADIAEDVYPGLLHVLASGQLTPVTPARI